MTLRRITYRGQRRHFDTYVNHLSLSLSVKLQGTFVDLTNVSLHARMSRRELLAANKLLYRKNRKNAKEKGPFHSSQLPNQMFPQQRLQRSPGGRNP